MKKILSLLTVLCLLLPLVPAAHAEPGLGSAFEGAQPAVSSRLSEVFERGSATAQPVETPMPEATSSPVLSPEPTPPPALFDEGVRDITCAAYGNRVDYAHIGGWIVSRGYLMDLEQYCLIGQEPGGRRAALTDTLPASFVPAGDALIYYGKDAKDKYNWVIRKPGEAPEKLSLGISDEVFYADADYIWYYTRVGEETSIRRLARKGGEKKGFGRTKGSPLVMLESGGVLVTDFDKNRIETWKDGKATTVYQPEKPIISVSSAGNSVWVEHEREFGLLEDGALAWRLPGHIVSMTGTTDQFVILLSFPGSNEYDVMIFNDRYRAYARVGYVPASENAFVELQTGRQMTVWGPEKSLIFDIPPADEWIPYGYYDMESARAARGLSAPAPTIEPAPTPTVQPDQDGTVTVTIPANLSALTDEATATAQAEAAGIRMTVNRDGSYTYFMTPEQHREQLDRRAQEIRDALESMLVTEPFSNAIKAYSANDDYSEITFTVAADRLEESMAVLVIAVVGLAAPTYQAMVGENEAPVTLIKVVDQATGAVIATYTGPDDFLK